MSSIQAGVQSPFLKYAYMSERDPAAFSELYPRNAAVGNWCEVVEW